jgi:hypothetical protein
MEDGGWLFEWSPGTSPYSIWLDGGLLDTAETESYECRLPNYEDSPPDLEILSDGATAENSLYPPRYRLQWRGLQGAAAYVIERYEGSEWITKATIAETLKGSYSWLTPALEDEASEQWRVSASDIAGNVGTPITFTFTVVRNPGAPAVVFSIDSSGDVVVGAA